MEYNIVPTILHLISTVRLPSQEVILINQLNQLFDFDHNIFLLDSALDPDRYVTTSTLAFESESGKCIPQSVYSFDNGPGDNNSETMTNLNEVTSKSTLLIVAVENLNFGNNSSILSEVERIRKLTASKNVKILMFSAQNVTAWDTAEQLFQWSWSVGIVKILCAFYSNVDYDPNSKLLLNVFRFDPFRTFHLINVTGRESYQDYYPEKVPNYHQYPIRFEQWDFWNVTYFTNFDNLFWDTVVRVLNASKLTIYTSREDVEKSDEIINGDIRLHEMGEKRDTYPHQVITYVLVVPHAYPYSDFLAYSKNATWTLLSAYIFIVVAAASLLLIVSGYLRTQKILLFQCVADVVHLLINDNGAIRYGQLYRADVCVIVPLTFTGLIVMNGVLSAYQSYLTVPIYERQINTFDDLFESPFPLLEDEFYWVNRTIKMLEDISPHGGWSEKVHATNYDKLRKEAMTFNNSIAFFGQSDEIKLLLQTQKRLNIKAYHVITETYLPKYFTSFLLNQNFPFTESINDIIHNFQSAGLIHKWINMDLELLSQNLLKNNRNLTLKLSSESHSGKFTIPTVVWYGWMTSGISFICEIIWKKIKTKFGGTK